MAALFDFIGKVNASVTEGKISRPDAGKIIKELESINKILGIIDFEEQALSRDIASLIQKREEARKAGKWQEADSLRNQLAGFGVEVSDSQQGTIWRFK